jgi:hypothetical protein
MDESNPSAAETIRRREDALYAAMIALDYAALDDLLSDDLSYVHSTGVVESKPAYLAALRRGLYEYGAITRRDRHAGGCGRIGQGHDPAAARPGLGEARRKMAPDAATGDPYPELSASG